MGAFVEVARLDQVKPGLGTAVAVGDCAVALFNVEGRMYAIEDSCVRCGASLAAGSLRGHDAICPGCGWRYDVRTGCIDGLPALCIDTFAVGIVDSAIVVASTAKPRGEPR